MKTPADSPALVWSTVSRRFALVSPDLARACLTVGSVEGFNRAITSGRPPRLESITIRQLATPDGPGITCAVEIRAGSDVLECRAGRVECKRIADALHAWTGAQVLNVKKGPPGRRWRGRIAQRVATVHPAASG